MYTLAQIDINSRRFYRNKGLQRHREAKVDILCEAKTTLVYFDDISKDGRINYTDVTQDIIITDIVIRFV
jgi:hypothetical protein